MRRYIARTQRSKDYTQEHRPHLADPRVVNGFRPLLKEIIYQIVVERSQGLARVGPRRQRVRRRAQRLRHEPVRLAARLRASTRSSEQLDLGYEIGPQHPLAGEVARLVCELTGFERAGLCNTGSEAVMGAMRIARTVTGRSTLVIFTGSYHGIFDEVIVRGTKKLRSMPAAPGILRNTAENVLVLDYGTPESAGRSSASARTRSPRCWSSRCRAAGRTSSRASSCTSCATITARCRRAADLRRGGHRLPRRTRAARRRCSASRPTWPRYGKVVGGGFPIGVIAGKREYMDALDGGHWQFGDDSIPTVGVTYFAGTFVRHPLALAAAKAVLEHLKAAGPGAAGALNARTAAMADELNAFCEEVGAPIEVKHFASVWKTFFTEDHPLQDLLFAMMRSRGIHILDNFPCFFTTAHSRGRLRRDREGVQGVGAGAAGGRVHPAAGATPSARLFDASRPPVPGARLGRDPDGSPAWFVAESRQPRTST